ncbi:AraC family transcriptional regulator [Clostridium sediminicola]|uniref:AraC family transcriptional regulator n=1 Tax=Clostridium sediminicola TaxID=3114879 RepID=UPI0031F1FDDE
MFGEYKFNVLHKSKYHHSVGLYTTWVGYLTALQNYECKPRVLDDYFIIFVSSGKGIFRCNNIEYKIKKHDAFFLFPGVVHYYKTDSKDLLELWWIGFNGPNAQKLINDLSITPDNCVIKGIHSAEIFDNIKEIVDSSLNSSSGMVLKSSGCLYKLFGQIINECASDSINIICEQAEFTKPIERSLAFIDANYPHYITIKQIATYAGLSRSHFTTRFKAEVGYSPSEHLAKIRLKQAKHYLCHSSLSIMEIAHSTGFQDPHYFSRFFKHHEGIPPIEFRRINSSCENTEEGTSKTPI